MLGPAIVPGMASHAYLFHGPPGAGKRTVARALASAWLADGSADAAGVAGRVSRGTHPDLTWVAPSGAKEMLVSDIDGPVVGASSLTPFESKRRVFVIEQAQNMNEHAANRLLKTLEEPGPGVHIILLADDRSAVLPTVVSRCQAVRFDAPSSEKIAAALQDAGTAPARARACARLALGDGQLARWLAGEDGDALRAQAEALVRTALGGTVGERPWLPLLASAKDAGRAAAEQTHAAVAEQAEQLPPKEARRHLREGAEAERRAERRRRSAVLDLGLRLAELWLRDVWCLAYGVSDAVHASDREAELRGFLAALQTGQVAVTQRGAEGAVAAQAPDVQAAEGVRVALGKAVELVAETRMRLALNVSEELALEALVYRLAARLRG